MTSELPFRSTADDFLKRLARDVESLKRHTHVDPAMIGDDGDYIPPMPPTDPVASTDWQADGARVAFSWTAPEYDTANAPLDDLSYYELRWQYQSAPGWHSITTDDVSATILGFTGSETLDWQVRAVDQNGNASDWLVDTVVTAADPTPPAGTDTLAPKPPTSLNGSGTYVPSLGRVDYELAWIPPTQNTDDTPLTDLMDYEVQWKYTGTTVWSSFTTPLDEATVAGLQPGIDIDWRVRARDTSGNPSTWATDTIGGVADSTPPNAPSTPSLTTQYGTITVTWDGLDSGASAMPVDFHHVRVYMGTAPGFTADATTEINRLYGPGSVVVADEPEGATRYFKFRAVDTSGNLSANSAEASIAVDGIPPPDPDTLAPKPPTALSASGAVIPGTVPTVRYTLSWTAPTQNTDDSPLTDLAGYNVRWRYTGQTSYTYLDSFDDEVLIQGVSAGLDVEWSVRAYDTSGNASTWASDTITGSTDSTPPDTPSAPTSSSSLGTIRVTWDGLDSTAQPMPSDFNYLGVFVSETTGGPWTYVDSLFGAGSVFVSGVPLGGVRYFSTIAYDTSGNASTRSAETVVTVTGVTGPDIEAGAITANNIYSGTLSASIALAGEIVAGDQDGARVEISETGIIQYDADGAVKVSIPTAGDAPAVFEGDLVADSLTVRDQFALRGTTNEIAKGSSLGLSDGTSSPTSPPSVQAIYEKYDGGITRFLSNTRGFHHEADGADPYYMGIFFYLADALGPGGEYWTFPTVLDDTGAEKSTWEVTDMTVLWDGSKQVVASLGLPWTAGNPIPNFALKTYDFSAMDTGGTTPPTTTATLSSVVPWGWSDAYKLGRCIGAGLSQQFVYAHRPSGSSTVNIRRYSVTTSAISLVGGSSIALSVTFGSGEGLVGVAYGSSSAMGFPGTDQTVILVFKTNGCVAFTTAGVPIPEFDFPMANTPAYVDVCGSTAGGANTFVGFRSTNSYQTEGEARWVTKYTNMHWPSGDSSLWWVSGTWHDPDSDGGTHETAQSPRRTITMPRRAALLVTVPPYPQRPFPTTTDDVTASRVYIGRGATDPGRTYMEYAGVTNDPVRTLTVTDFTFPAGTASTPPPIVSDFPASAPATITSADETSWILSGDGSAFFTDVEAAGDLTIAGDVVFTGGRVVYPQYEIMLDGSVELQTAGALPFNADRSVYLDRWSVWETSGTASSAVVATGNAYDGGQVLALTSGGGYERATSEHFDVIPGRTYVAHFRVGKLGSGTSRLYVRMAGGTDDDLTEYPGSSSTTGIQPVGTIENLNAVSLGADAASANPALFEDVSFGFTAPAGVVRAAWSVTNFQTTGTVTVWMDSFTVTEVRNEGDTGWVTMTKVNSGSWTDSGGVPVAWRVKNGIVWMRGDVQSVPSGSWYQIGRLPVGVAPEVIGVNAALGIGANVHVAGLVDTSGNVSVYSASTTSATATMRALSWPME